MHFLEAGEIGGILEFMTETQKQMLEDAEHFNAVRAIPCIPMQTIFAQLNIDHINFFSLDVEGAELSVLRTIDFSRVQFDVIVMEACSDWQQVASTQKLLLDNGYVNALKRAFDLWFVREGFKPTFNPSAQVCNIMVCVTFS